MTACLTARIETRRVLWDLTQPTDFLGDPELDVKRTSRAGPRGKKVGGGPLARDSHKKVAAKSSAVL